MKLFPKTCLVLAALLVLAPLIAGAMGQDPAKETGALRFYNFTSPVEKAAGEAAVAAFKQKYPNVQVSIEYPQKWDFATLAAEVITETLADVLLIPAWDRGWMGNFTSKEMLLNLEPYIAKDRTFKKGDYFTAAVNTLSRGSTLYAFPAGADGIMIQYNKKMFRDAGLKTPTELMKENNWTWETFREAAMKLAKTDSSGKMTIGGYLMDTDWNWSAYWSFTNGVTRYFSEDLKENYFDDPRVIEALQFVQDAIYKDKYAPDPTASFEPIIWYWFANNKLAMNRATWQQFGDTYEGVEFDVAPVPKKVQYATTFYGMGVGVFAKTKNPAAAVDLAKMVAEEFMKETAAKGYMLPAKKSLMSEYGANHPERDRAVLSTIAASAFPFQWDLGWHPKWNTDYSAWTADMDRIIMPAFDKWTRNQLSAKDMLTQLAKDLREYAAKNIK